MCDQLPSGGETEGRRSMRRFTLSRKSHVEIYHAETKTLLEDPATAHTKAKDPGTEEEWSLYLPLQCISCAAKELSKRHAEEATQGDAE